MHDMPYAIEYQRELTEEEKSLVSFLILRGAPERISEVNSLKVVARCGCGKCPTVIFGHAQQLKPELGPFTEIANYAGKNDQGVLVGVALLERDGKLSELEAWSPAGDEILHWPAVNSLERVA